MFLLFPACHCAGAENCNDQLTWTAKMRECQVNISSPPFDHFCKKCFFDP